MALWVRPPPQGFPHARRSSKMSTEWPARASCSPHMAPEGPPPTIAISAIFLFSRVLAGNACFAGRGTCRVRMLLADRSGDGENHQTKACEEYSTEKGGGCRGAAAGANNVHTAPLQQGEKDEVGCEKHEKDFAAMQMEERDEDGEPGDKTKRHRRSEAAPSSETLGRAEK